MFRVLGVSLGSAERNFSKNIELLGKEIQLTRMGTNGSLEKAKEVIKEYDGQVDVFSLGGTNLNYVLGEKRYPIKEGQQLAKLAKKTPVVDGELVKAALDVETINFLQKEGIVKFSNKKVFFVSALDRYYMAKTIEDLGAKVTVGDAILALGLPVPFRSLKLFSYVARLTMPAMRHIPLAFLYPLGKRQKENRPRHQGYFHEADIIAGDYHFIGRNMPEDLTGKIIITNTVTSKNIQAFKQRGVKLLVTTSPEIGGRSFGGNILQGMFLVLKGSNGPLRPEEIINLAKQIGWMPRIEYLNPN